MDDFGVQNENEYLVTAHQIFDFCGVRDTACIPVDSLMDKLSASEKSNKSEYKHLKNILDPKENNPNIDVTELADALHKYSETQKEKVDPEDSFNLKSGSVPQDSDSGISNDGFQLLEELQCELREKSQLTSQLRDEMYFMEQQNDELLSGLKAERDGLKAQLLILREEKQKFISISHDYEDACTRLASTESAFEHARRDLEISRKNNKSLGDTVEQLQIDKQSLEELLSKSKEECHRINEMYAVRQASLLEENETLKSEHADIQNRYEDQQHLIQKIIQEKCILEMELKDILNKSVESPKFDNTIEISYVDDQVLSTIDSITVDSKFGSQQLLEDSFTALNNSEGRATNMTLFDEIRLSFCNSPFTKGTRNTASTQTEHNNNCECNVCAFCFESENMRDKCLISAKEFKDQYTETNIANELKDQYTETNNPKDLNDENTEINSAVKSKDKQNDTNTACKNCDKLNLLLKKLEKQYEFDKNLSIISIDYSMIDNKVIDDSAVELNPSNVFDHELTNHTDTCKECDRNSKNVENKDLVDCKKCIELKLYIEELEANKRGSNLEKVHRTCETQTVQLICEECLTYKEIVNKLELNLDNKCKALKEAESNLLKQEDNVNNLVRCLEERTGLTANLQITIDYLKSKLADIESTFDEQKLLLGNLKCDNETETRNECVQANVSTQTDQPCEECVKRKSADEEPKKVSSFLWNSLKSLFQLFAIICFCMAIYYMYNVTQQHSTRACRRGRIPWRWFTMQDLLDLVLRIEYVGEIPM